MNRKISFLVMISIVCLFSIIFHTQSVFADTETKAETGIYNDIDTYLRSCAEKGADFDRFIKIYRLFA